MAGGRSDHTAALITHIRLAAGDKDAKPTAYNPYRSADYQAEARRQFAELAKKGQAENGKRRSG